MYTMCTRMVGAARRALSAVWPSRSGDRGGAPLRLPPRVIYGRIAIDQQTLMSRPTPRAFVRAMKQEMAGMLREFELRHLHYLGSASRPIFGNLYMPAPFEPRWAELMAIR